MVLKNDEEFARHVAEGLLNDSRRPLPLIVDESGTYVDHPLVAERGRPPPCDARPAQIDPEETFGLYKAAVRDRVRRYLH
ncbi:hypothetical protein [Burkholderia sp. Bp8984]|uniref:hypothetical protein n=1 Tax=Burkholderia sp. Bp8984 TaxID=2184549 RepID=UPI0016250C2A|nr:hypothetical protein [Burkholderia sp. Bp8984]